jgi:predicted flap endonuclease-1-like 5' DNA nuclease
LAAFALRLIGAGLFTIVMMLLAGLLMTVRPDFVATVKSRMQEQTALSFATGILANLALLFLVALLGITICLLPVALVPLLALLALNLAGWTAASVTVGQRMAEYLKLSLRPAATAALGALALTGVASTLWAFGGCLRFIGFVMLLLVASAGAGAVILPWLKAGARGKTATQASAVANGPESAAGAPPEAELAAMATARMNVAAVESVELAVEEVEETTVAVAPETAESEQAEAAPVEPVEAALEAAPLAAGEADFTRIKGIGAIFDRRLKTANVHTFGQLAALSAEEIAQIIGWPPERVVRDNLIGQARALAEEERL